MPRFTRHYTTDLIKDAMLLASRTEEIHPSFRIGEVADDYETIRDAYLTAVNRPTMYEDFYFATMKYLTALRDGHAGIINASFAATTGTTPKQLPFDVTYADGKLYAVKNGLPSDEIVAIGGIPSAQIIATVAEHIYVENEAAREKLFGQLCAITPILKRARCTFGESVLVVFRGKDGEREETFALTPQRTNTSAVHADYIIKCETRGDVFVIDLRYFIVHQSVDEACQQIKPRSQTVCASSSSTCAVTTAATALSARRFFPRWE